MIVAVNILIFKSIGLFILINFFKSLGVSEAELEKRINEWNEKNSQPLKKGYIQSQLTWYKKNGSRMPPNCDKPNYKDLAICKPDELCKPIKNPINYAVKNNISYICSEILAKALDIVNPLEINSINKTLIELDENLSAFISIEKIN